MPHWQPAQKFPKKKDLILEDRIKKHGLRNGYLLAAAPTSSTSIIAGTTAGLDPVMNRYFLEEKKIRPDPKSCP